LCATKKTFFESRVIVFEYVSPESTQTLTLPSDSNPRILPVPNDASAPSPYLKITESDK